MITKQSDVPYPDSDGIANPLPPGIDSPFPPTDQEEAAGPIASAAETTPSGGLIGDATSTYQNLSDC